MMELFNDHKFWYGLFRGVVSNFSNHRDYIERPVRYTYEVDGETFFFDIEYKNWPTDPGMNASGLDDLYIAFYLHGVVYFKVMYQRIQDGDDNRIDLKQFLPSPRLLLNDVVPLAEVEQHLMILKLLLSK